MKSHLATIESSLTTFRFASDIRDPVNSSAGLSAIPFKVISKTSEAIKSIQVEQSALAEKFMVLWQM